MAADILKITILDDGTIKTETDPISAANHSSAEAFLSDVTKLAGGPVERKRKAGHHHHHHHGTTTHTHEHNH
jgi:hypothetical protein